MKLRGALCAALFLILSGCIFAEEEVRIKDDMGLEEPDIGPIGCTTNGECGGEQRCCGNVCTDVSATGGYCLCEGRTLPTPTTISLGAPGRYEVVPFYADPKVGAAESPSFVVVKQEGPRALSVRMLDESGAVVGSLETRSEVARTGEIVNFKVVSVAEGVLVIINMNYPLRGEAISRFLVARSPDNRTIDFVKEEEEEPQMTHILAMGARIVEDGVIFAQIFGNPFSADTVLGISYTEDLGQETERTIVEVQELNGIFIRDRSLIELNVVGGLNAGSLTATWEGSDLSNSTVHGVLTLTFVGGGVDKREVRQPLNPQSRPAFTALRDAPSAMLPLFGGAAGEWFYLYANYGEVSSTLNLGPAADRSRRQLAAASTIISPAFNFVGSEAEGVAPFIFGWIEAETRPMGASAAPMGKLAVATFGDGPRNMPTLGPEELLSDQDIYTRLSSVSHAADVQAFFGERAAGNTRALDLFLMWRGQRICASGGDVTTSN